MKSIDQIELDALRTSHLYNQDPVVDADILAALAEITAMAERGEVLALTVTVLHPDRTSTRYGNWNQKDGGDLYLHAAKTLRWIEDMT
jgi:hypothetical protein